MPHRGTGPHDRRAVNNENIVNTHAHTLVILCTMPDSKTAQAVATTLVSEHLAACINITGPMTSIYHWEGQLEQATEHLLLIKTTSTTYPQLETRLKALHPYEVPEILALPVAGGLASYLEWLGASVINSHSQD